MKKVRAILVGALVWFFIFVAFAGINFIAVLKNSLDQKSLIIGFLIVPFTVFGAWIYYKNGNRENGYIVGLIMVLTALILDALITVPLSEIPNGRGYQSFFSYPLLWLLAAVNFATVVFYWRWKVLGKIMKKI